MCEICRHNPCLPQCPNYEPPKAMYYCDFCGEGIYEGDEYIENDEGKHMHFECIQGLRHLLEWLNYDVKYMEDEE